MRHNEAERQQVTTFQTCRDNVDIQYITELYPPQRILKFHLLFSKGRILDLKTGTVKKEGQQSSMRMCMGSRRSFICRMRCVLSWTLSLSEHLNTCKDTFPSGLLGRTNLCTHTPQRCLRGHPPQRCLRGHTPLRDVRIFSFP